MSKIAVIGGGIFGTVAALELAAVGHEVTIFEKEELILSKGTKNSQNRLHLGLHYPRDLDTARQSVTGFQSFQNRFPNSVDLDFPNYYALALKDSKTDLSNFLKFANEAKIDIKEVQMDYLKDLGINPEDYAGIWLCNEGVIDISILRSLIQDEIKKSTVKILTKTEIVHAESNGSWHLWDQDHRVSKFDLVFRCTYGSDRMTINQTDHKIRNYEFHKTAILNVELNQPRFGFTIIDGDFLTILPDGKSKNSLVYAPSISTLLRSEGINYPEEWDTLSEAEFAVLCIKLSERVEKWTPGVRINKVNGAMLAVRSIQPNVSDTDRRTSSIVSISDNFYDVWSGKIDHCVDLSRQMLDLS